MPGFADANALWHSDIGLALRGALASDVTELEDDVADTETEFLSATDYVTQLDLMVADGVIEATERSMLIRLYKGCKMTDMAVEPEIKMALRRRRMTFDVFVTDLQARIERWGTTQARQSE